jgi:capsular polysaccharide biosynthesis protein
VSQLPPDPAPPYLTIITRWIVSAVVIFAATWFLGLFIGDDVMTQTYEAMAEIQLQPGDLDANAQGKSALDVLRSSDVLLPVIQKLNLKQRWADRTFHDQTLISDDDAVAYLNTRLKIEVVKDTTIVQITALSDVPPFAATIANGIVDEYKAQRDADQAAAADREINDLRQQVADQQKVVDSNLSAMDRVDQTNDLDSLKLRLNQALANATYQDSPVLIVTRAQAPTEGVGRLATRIVSGILATILAISGASFIEVAVMLTRASARV